MARSRFSGIRPRVTELLNNRKFGFEGGQRTFPCSSHPATAKKDLWGGGRQERFPFLSARSVWGGQWELMGMKLSVPGFALRGLWGARGALEPLEQRRAVDAAPLHQGLGWELGLIRAFPLPWQHPFG